MVLRDRSWVAGFALVACLAAPATALAEVRLLGEWPTKDPKVTLELAKVTRAEALRRLAEAAGYSVVVRGLDEERVDLFVKDAPASEVFNAILDNGKWVAKRDDAIVVISAEAPAAPVAEEVKPAPESEPAIPTKPRDVEVFGNSLRIAKDEVVRDVTVMGGNVVIEGRVTGDLSVLGGNAELMPGARVEGDASVTGGRIKIQEGARIEGDLGVLGGSIEGAEKAKVGGSVKLDPDGSEKATFAQRAGRTFADGVRTAAFLFVLGSIVIALGGLRAERLRSEIAARPMRSAALGLVGLIVGLLSIAVAAITMIGLPIAAIGAVLGVAAIFAGMTSALTVAGAAAFGHKSSNIYVHLAVGAGMFMLLGIIPIVGGLAQAGVVLAGIGSVVATRAAGLVGRRGESSGEPYR